jgi:hypothetical protein
MTAATLPCRIGESCAWDIVGARIRQAKQPRPAPLPPDQREPKQTYDVNALPTHCQANHTLLDTATVLPNGTVVCAACYHLAPKQPNNQPVVPLEFATTGGRGLAYLPYEREVTTQAELLRREQLTRLSCIRQQLRRNQTIVWNAPELAGEWYQDDKPMGIGIYVWPLDVSERQALIDEANELRAILHIGVYDGDE